jgi:hypothetical protein
MKHNIFIDSYETFLSVSSIFKNHIKKSEFIDGHLDGIINISIEVEVGSYIFCVNYIHDFYEQVYTILDISKGEKIYIFSEDSSVLSNYHDLIDNENVCIVLFFINGEYGHIDYTNDKHNILDYLNKGNKIICSIIFDEYIVNLLQIDGLSEIVNHKNYNQNFYSYFMSAKPILGYFFDINEHKFDYKKKYDICYYERPNYKKERDSIKKSIKKSNLKVNTISEISSKWKSKYNGIFHDDSSNGEFMHKVLGVYSNDNSYLFSKFFYDYIDSYLGICFETIQEDEQEFFMTEKTFKFLYYGLPFYNVCSKRTMRELKKMGFFSYDMLVRNINNKKNAKNDFYTFINEYNTREKIEELTNKHIDKFKKNMELVNFYINEENEYKNQLLNFIFE